MKDDDGMRQWTVDMGWGLGKHEEEQKIEKSRKFLTLALVRLSLSRSQIAGPSPSERASKQDPDIPDGLSCSAAAQRSLSSMSVSLGLGQSELPMTPVDPTTPAEQRSSRMRCDRMGPPHHGCVIAGWRHLAWPGPALVSVL